MPVPTDRRYQKSHEWARPDGDEVVFGISAFAVEALQDLVFIELPAPGDTVTAGQPFGEIESVKAVSDLFAPVGGEVTAVNEALEEDLEILKTDPYDAGWMVRIRPTGDAAAALESLLDAAAYQALIDAVDPH